MNNIKDNLNGCNIKSVLPHFSIGVNILGTIKPRMLYSLGGMYSSCHYKKTDSGIVMETNITIPQLSQLTGESIDYIGDVFYPHIKKQEQLILSYTSLYDKVSHQRRNKFIMATPIKPYRIYWSSIFRDTLLTPEEKGYIMALYMLCVTGARRYELNNHRIAKSLGVTLNTWKKYKSILEDKGILKKARDLGIGLFDPVTDDSNIIFYPHVGTNPHLTFVSSQLGEERVLEESLN